MEDERIEFEEGNLVTFSEVQGMTELNSHPPVRIKSVGKQYFEIDLDTRNFKSYVSGGIVTQQKESKILKFKSYKDAIVDPGEFLQSDFSKFERSPMLHLAFQALDRYFKEYKVYPSPGNEDDINKFLMIFHELNNKKIEMNKGNEKILKIFAWGSSTELSPMAAAFGGIAGQEALKACSGKFHPIHQFLHFDIVESLPEYPLSQDEIKGRNNRFDAQIAVFGRTIQNKLENMKVFLVGAGALGCEFLKNFAMMGIATMTSGTDDKHKGLCIVTDDDQIEKSNLSRQFLFRDRDIKKAKSTVAAEAVAKMQNNFKVKALQNRVSPHTEDVFNDDFWQDLDLVVNALDNVNARLYVDSKCVYYGKPLLESGTLGPKCNTQVVIPNITENYGSSRDPPEKSAPMCTLHSFPHNINHCLVWSRSEFTGMFEDMPNETNAFLDDPMAYCHKCMESPDATTRGKVENILTSLSSNMCRDFESCLKVARYKFEELFHNKISQLVFSFPEDSTTSSGTMFWSPPKRFPQVIEFSESDQSHLNCIRALAILTAQVYNVIIPPWVYDNTSFGTECSKIIIPEFKPQSGYFYAIIY